MIIVILELCTFTSCRTNAIWSTGSAKDFTKQIVIPLALIDKSQTFLPPPPSPFASSLTRNKQLRVLFEGSEAQTNQPPILPQQVGGGDDTTQAYSNLLPSTVVATIIIIMDNYLLIEDDIHVYINN